MWKMSDLESVTSETSSGRNTPFPLMSKDTRAGSRRTEPQIVAVRRVFRHKWGVHLPREVSLRVYETPIYTSDAPALCGSPTEHDLWGNVTYAS